jgi:hypothetical protein
MLGVPQTTQQQDPGQDVCWQVADLPKVPVELCAPLHCMLAEAAAFTSTGSIISLHLVLALMQVLQDIYFEVGPMQHQNSLALIWHVSVLVLAPCPWPSSYCLAP